MRRKLLFGKVDSVAPGESPGSAGRLNRIKQFSHAARFGVNCNGARQRESEKVLRRSKERACKAWQLALIRVKDYPESVSKSQEGCIRRAMADGGLSDFEIIKEICDWDGQPPPRKRDDKGR